MYFIKSVKCHAKARNILTFIVYKSEDATFHCSLHLESSSGVTVRGRTQVQQKWIDN